MILGNKIFCIFATNLNRKNMKKALIAMLFFCLTGFVMAQEANETEFKMSLGDTIVWTPFADCNMLGYNIKGPKVISFKPVHFGEKIEIIAKKVGKCSIVATCQDTNLEAVASITVLDPNDVPIITEKPVKPETLPFTSTYSFNPPKNNFFITINNTGTGFNETYMKHGDDEAFNDGQGIDRFWNVKTGKN